VVTCRSARGVPYVHRFGRRDGVRIGGGQRAELVSDEGAQSGLQSDRRAAMRVDAAYRAWAQEKDDLEKLRDLQAAISEALDANWAGQC